MDLTLFGVAVLAALLVAIFFFAHISAHNSRWREKNRVFRGSIKVSPDAHLAEKNNEN